VSAPGGYSPTDQDVASGIPKTIETAGQFTTRGNQLLDRGRYAEAIEDFDAALSLFPRDANTLADRALSYIGRRDLPDARKDLTDAYALDAHDEYVFHGRGELAMATGDYVAAVAAFTAALQIDAKDEFALKMRSRSEVTIGKKQEALADINHAIALNPKHADLYWYRAMIWRSLGNKEAALREPRRLLSADPGDAAAYLVAGRMYAELGQHSLAVQSLNRSIEIQPTDSAYLARALQRPMTDLQARRSDFEAAVRLNPDSAYDLESLAQAAADDHDYEEAISASTRATAIAGKIPLLLAIRGVGYAKTHQLTLAEQDFSEAVEKAKSPNDLNNVCWTMATFGVDLDRALSLCEAAVNQASGTAKAAYLDSRGFVLLRLGRFKEAIAAYDAALAIQPLLPSSLYGRGICELRTGDRKDAANDLRDGKSFSEGAVAVDFKRYGVGPTGDSARP
jgi:tetratricopeptide (TPR) repeat protein